MVWCGVDVGWCFLPSKGSAGGTLLMWRKDWIHCQSTPTESKIADFRSIIDRIDLNDLPLKGGRWTWSNQRENYSFSRIVSFLITSDLLLTSLDINQKVLSRPISYHFPILLVSDGIQWSLIPFRLDNK